MVHSSSISFNNCERVRDCVHSYYYKALLKPLPTTLTLPAIFVSSQLEGWNELVLFPSCHPFLLFIIYIIFLENFIVFNHCILYILYKPTERPVSEATASEVVKPFNPHHYKLLLIMNKLNLY